MLQFTIYIRSPLGSRIYERSFGEMGHRNPPLLFQPQTKNSVFENDFPSASISGTTTKHKKKYKPTDSLGLGTLHAWSPLSLSLSLYRAGLFVIWNFTSLIFEKRVQRHQLSINDMHARNDLFFPIQRTFCSSWANRGCGSADVTARSRCIELFMARCEPFEGWLWTEGIYSWRRTKRMCVFVCECNFH